MNPIGVVVVLAVLGALGVVVTVSALAPSAPPLDRVLADLERDRRSGADDRRRRAERTLTVVADRYPQFLPSATQLRVVGRSREQHVAWLAIAAVAGFVGPGVVLAALQALGVVGLIWVVPVFAAVLGAVLGPLVVHATVVERAQQLTTDLRYQTSAFLDVVTMLLAGNTGYEGALDQAARSGDGRLFVELQRRMRDAATRGQSLTVALHRLGAEFGLDELQQIAVTAELSASEGAPVARSLAAKCATLRASLASEQETEARLRTSRLTTPIVGMALIFMGLVIFPALSFP